MREWSAFSFNAVNRLNTRRQIQFSLILTVLEGSRKLNSTPDRWHQNYPRRDVAHTKVYFLLPNWEGSTLSTEMNLNEGRHVRKNLKASSIILEPILGGKFPLFWWNKPTEVTESAADPHSLLSELQKVLIQTKTLKKITGFTKTKHFDSLFLKYGHLCL